MHATSTKFHAGGIRGTPSSPLLEQNVEPEAEVLDQYSVLQVQDGAPEEGMFQLMEAEAQAEERCSSQKPRVPYEENKGYGTLARVDPALAMADRPIRYSDLRPTTPEADEVRNTLEKWRIRILEAPFPVRKADLMRQFFTKEKDVGYPAILAVEQMIEMRLAVEAKQTALRLAAREQFGTRMMAAQNPKERRSCTQTQLKPTPRSRMTSTRQSRRSSMVDSGSGPDKSTMAFRALEVNVPNSGLPEATISSVPRGAATEEMICSPAETELDHFVFLESEVVSRWEEEL